MTYIPGTKRYTKRQLADGVSADGLKLDAALEDTVRVHNDLPRADIRTRYTRQVYAWGWEPPLDDLAALNVEDQPATKLPFMQLNNTANETLHNTGQNTYALRGTNPWRNKGCNVTVVDPVVDPASTHGTAQYAWTNALRNVAPALLDSVHLMLLTDPTFYDNLWTFSHGPGIKSPATAIGPSGSADWLNDLVLQVQLDSPLAPNVARMSALEFNVWNLRLESFQILDYAAVVVDFAPPSIIGFPDGVALQFEGLEIPLPEYAQLRLSLILPKYDAAIWTTPWGDKPWQKQAYHMAMTLLEEIR